MAILIVDDEYFVARAIARCIPPEEAVVIVHDAASAETYIAGGAWTAFIIDVRLRETSGFDLLEGARTHHPRTPALLVTGWDEPSWSERAAALGADLATKPFDKERIRRFVADASARALGERRAPFRGSETSQQQRSTRGDVLLVENDANVVEYVERLLQREKFSIASVSPEAFASRVADLKPRTNVLSKLSLCAAAESYDRSLETLVRERPDLNVIIGSRELGLVGALMHVASAGWSDASPASLEFRERLIRTLLREEGCVRSATPPRTEGSRPRKSAPVMNRVLALVDKVAESARAPVLLVGESGVGKEVLATRIHERSPRRNGPFLRINVPAIADGMLEAELFGSVRGAYTDARRDRAGLLASANGGTLLLDEIGECRPEIQVKLLRVLETQRYFPVGSDEERAVDVRLIGATNRPPADVLAGGTFRTDLLFRFGTVITVPPLRERKDEIMQLAEAFAAQSAAELGRGPLRFSQTAQEALRGHDWPGNIRELKHVIEHAVLLAEGAELTPELFELRFNRTGTSAETASPASALADTRATTERTEIQNALDGARGSATAAAKRLGISRSTLYQKLKKYRLR